MLSLTDFFGAASWHHNDVILLPAIYRVPGNHFVPAGQCTGTPRLVLATAELLRQETPNFFAPNLWPSNSSNLSPVDYEIWAMSCSIVFTTDKSIVWMNWNGGSSLPERSWTVDFWRDYWRDEDIGRVSMPKEDISSTTCELTMFSWFCPYLLCSMWFVWLFHL